MSKLSDMIDVTVTLAEPMDVHSRIAFGVALASDWEPILRTWLAECGERKTHAPNEMSTECERYWRLRDVLSRCLHAPVTPTGLGTQPKGGKT